MTTYALVSVPPSVEPPLDSLIASDTAAQLRPFAIPEFKIGTLDALVQQADDLAKLNSACEGLVQKVLDTLRSLHDGDQDKVQRDQIVNDKPTDQYLQNFAWNRARYRADKPIAELVTTLQKELANTDNDIKAKLNQYNQVKTTLTSLQRKQTGNLATKSLTPVVDPSLLVRDSEYLETHLVAVPNNLKKEFLQTYEKLTDMVVPRSSVEIAHDDEFVLFAVTTFKKFSADFQHKCREQKWTPRQYHHVEGGREEEQKELDRVARDEKKVWGEALRLSRTGWSESVMIWFHVMALRVFVESVLRYGLPLDFEAHLLAANPKSIKKLKTSLDSSYSYLGGNAFGRDKRGRVTKDDAAMSSEMAAAGLGHGGEGSEYTAYVYYEFEI